MHLSQKVCRKNTWSQPIKRNPAADIRLRSARADKRAWRCGARPCLQCEKIILCQVWSTTTTATTTLPSPYQPRRHSPNCALPNCAAVQAQTGPRPAVYAPAFSFSTTDLWETSSASTQRSDLHNKRLNVAPNNPRRPGWPGSAWCRTTRGPLFRSRRVELSSASEWFLLTRLTRLPPPEQLTGGVHETEAAGVIYVRYKAMSGMWTWQVTSVYPCVKTRLTIVYCRFSPGSAQFVVCLQWPSVCGAVKDDRRLEFWPKLLAVVPSL